MPAGYTAGGGSNDMYKKGEGINRGSALNEGGLWMREYITSKYLSLRRVALFLCWSFFYKKNLFDVSLVKTKKSEV